MAIFPKWKHLTGFEKRLEFVTGNAFLTISASIEFIFFFAISWQAFLPIQPNQM